MTRNEAIKEVGIEAVNAVERLNCDFTNRLMENGYTEFSACYDINDEESIIAYYYQKDEDINVEDFSDLDWEIERYELV